MIKTTSGYTLMVKFQFSSETVILQPNTKDLGELKLIIEGMQKTHSFAGLKVYSLEGTKWKVINLKKFYQLTSYVTEFEIFLSSIYDAKQLGSTHKK